MARILKRLTAQLGGDEDKAARALHRSGNLVPGTKLPTKQGMQRGDMSPADRALNRAVLRSGGSMQDYTYDPKTNRTKRRK